MINVYVEHGQACMQDIFYPIGWGVVDDPNKADVIQLIGGADIHPIWYNGIAHHRTGGNLHRDSVTAELYALALDKDLPILGVCRGAQFINALVGGDMYQDVDGHHQYHDIVDVFTNKVWHVNSIHHQMIIPTKDAVCIAKATPQVATYRDTMDKDGVVNNPVTDLAPEWEVVFYPHVKGLCFQAHPEYVNKDEDTRQYYYELLRTYYPQLF